MKGQKLCFFVFFSTFVKEIDNAQPTLLIVSTKINFSKLNENSIKGEKHLL